MNLSGISSGAANESQTLSVTATSSNLTLIPNPTVTYSSSNTTGSLRFTPVANAYGTANIAVTVNDGSTSNNTISRIFTVTVNPVNDPPTLNTLTNRTINEDVGLQTVSLSGISSGNANEVQPLAVTATSSDPNLIPNPTVVYTSTNTTGSLTFVPVIHSNGTATITVTVNDGQAASNTIARTFTVTVTAINDPPTIDPIGNLALTKNAGPLTVVLTGISSGAPNENQVLTVTTTSSNPGIVPNPAVSYESPNASGALILAPATNSTGSAIITVTVKDPAALSNTTSRAFTVTVNPGNTPPTLHKIRGVTVNESAGLQTVSLTQISSGATNENQPLDVSATSSNPGLIPNPTVNYISPDSTGSLSFTPAPDAFGTATIAVTVDDGQATQNTITRSFKITVLPTAAQLSIGSTMLQAGQTSSVPIIFNSSSGVTACDIVLDLPPGRLTNLNLQSLAPEIDPASTTITPQTATTWLLHLAARPSQTILVSTPVVRLGFTAIADQHSAFVPLSALPFTAARADGSLITDRPVQPGRVVIIAQESLLEASLNPDGTPGLMLYGKPFSSYAIEYATQLYGTTNWTRLSSDIPLATLAAPVQGLYPPPGQIFYRAVEIVP